MMNFELLSFASFYFNIQTSIFKIQDLFTHKPASFTENREKPDKFYHNPTIEQKAALAIKHSCGDNHSP